MIDSSNATLMALKSINEQAWLSLGAVAESTCDVEQIILSYEKVLQHNAHNVIAYTALGIAYQRVGNFAHAVEKLHMISTITPKNGENWNSLGYCFLKMRNLPFAFQCYQHALFYCKESNPGASCNPLLWKGVGLLYEKLQYYEEAEEIYESVFKMRNVTTTMQHEIRMRLSIVAKLKGYHDVALERLRSLSEKNLAPELAAEIYLNIGHICELKGDRQHAKNAYFKAIEVHPASSIAYQQLGWLCMAAENESKMAIEYLKKAVAVDSTDAKAWYLLGRCYMSMGSSEDAYTAYKNSVHFDQEDPIVWCSLGVLFYQLNQLLDALDAYSRAINLNPNICEVWYNVANLYDTCNQTSDAHDAYRKAAELGADASFINTRLEALKAKENGMPSSSPSPGPSEPPMSSPLGPHNPPPATKSYLIPTPAPASGLSDRDEQQQQRQPQQQVAPGNPQALQGIIQAAASAMTKNAVSNAAAYKASYNGDGARASLPMMAPRIAVSHGMTPSHSSDPSASREQYLQSQRTHPLPSQLRNNNSAMGTAHPQQSCLPGQLHHGQANQSNPRHQFPSQGQYPQGSPRQVQHPTTHVHQQNRQPQNQYHPRRTPQDPSNFEKRQRHPSQMPVNQQRGVHPAMQSGMTGGMLRRDTRFRSEGDINTPHGPTPRLSGLDPQGISSRVGVRDRLPMPSGPENPSLQHHR